MNTFVICFICITIFAPFLVNGLQCYECTFCSEPFNRNNASIITVNNTGDSCYKITAAGVATVRGSMSNCVTLNAFGYGTWCCNTDLCNTAQPTISMNLKLLISTLFLGIIVININN